MSGRSIAWHRIQSMQTRPVLLLGAQCFDTSRPLNGDVPNSRGRLPLSVSPNEFTLSQRKRLLAKLSLPYHRTLFKTWPNCYTTIHVLRCSTRPSIITNTSSVRTYTPGFGEGRGAQLMRGRRRSRWKTPATSHMNVAHVTLVSLFYDNST